MRQVIQRLEALPPWSWSFTVTPQAGKAPLVISVQKNHGGAGINLGGPVYFRRNGQEVAKIDKSWFTFTLNEPGDYTVETELGAITNTGYRKEPAVAKVSVAPATPSGGGGQPGGSQGTNLVNMIVTAQSGIAIKEALFKLEGPGAPAGEMPGTNKLGQFTASFTVPEPAAGNSATYQATVGVLFDSELGSGAIKSAPMPFLMTTTDRGVLFSVRYDPQTNNFFINNDGIQG
ncbi:hypothetical protein LF252_06730 [Hymenobacter sp. BT728]|nr:hypothetical protein [Hymenobacter pini]